MPWIFKFDSRKRGDMVYWRTRMERSWAVEMENAFLKTPVYSEPNMCVLLVLENNILNRYLRISDSLKKLISKEEYDVLNGTCQFIIHFAFMEKKVTIKEVMKYTGKSRVTVSKALKQLRDKGILQWHGAGVNDPTQYYSLKEKV